MLGGPLPPEGQAAGSMAVTVWSGDDRCASGAEEAASRRAMTGDASRTAMTSGAGDAGQAARKVLAGRCRARPRRPLVDPFSPAEDPDGGIGIYAGSA